MASMILAKLFCFALYSSALATSDEAECLECDMKMLQLDTKVTETHSQDGTREKRSPKSLKNCGHLTQDTCFEGANAFCSNNCPIHTHGKDCYRPVPEVMAEHPGEDGYCYFNQTGFWVAPLDDHDPTKFAESAIQGITYLRGLSGYIGFNKGPKVTFNFDGLEITSHMDATHYLYDDLYGYSLGYLQGQGLTSEMMMNSSMWISLAEEKCNKIQEKYNFQNEELILADWLDDNIVINTRVSCAAKMPIPPDVPQNIRDAAKYKSVDDCEPVTRREFAKHHYIKCLLGYQNAASDGAYLNMRACLLDGGTRIGHFSECPYSPDMSF